MDQALLDNGSRRGCRVLWILMITLASSTLAQPADSPRVAAVTTLDLPAPSGPHAVGSRLFHWVDRSRREGATATPDDHRELFVQLWYPATMPGEGAKRTPYFRQLDAYVDVFGEALVDRLRQVRAHSIQDASIDKSLDEIPVVLFSHGWRAQGAAYTALLEDLASHGYVVAAIDQPFQGRIAMADGSVTPATEDHFRDPMEMVAFYGRDQQVVLDRLSELNQAGEMFSGRLALGQVGSIGHSNGALAALQVAKIDERIGAVVALDSWDPAFESLFKLEVPLLLLRTGGASEPNPAYARSAQAGLYDALIRGGDHLSSSDWPFIKATHAEERAFAASALSGVRRSLADFLGVQLKGEAAGRFLALRSRDGIEVRVLSPPEEVGKQ